MARTKVRNYPSIEHYEKEIEEYFRENQSQVIQYTVHKLGYNSLEELQEAEYNMAFGLDCGWVYLVPHDMDMFHEWELDNGKYCAHVYVRGPFGTQSVTIKECFAEKLIEDKNWEDIFWIDTRLD